MVTRSGIGAGLALGLASMFDTGELLARAVADGVRVGVTEAACVALGALEMLGARDIMLEVEARVLALALAVDDAVTAALTLGEALALATSVGDMVLEGLAVVVVWGVGELDAVGDGVALLDMVV